MGGMVTLTSVVLVTETVLCSRNWGLVFGVLPMWTPGTVSITLCNDGLVSSALSIDGSAILWRSG